MIGGQALSSRAIGDATRRDMPSEWGGPEPAATQSPLPIARRTARRVTVRKP